ncbi:MAG: hypothetical protein HC836_46965 [Richelia sp. RM2_1_2]|nr:hypothetical protein [Richelia sp. RM2_1_2]
MSNPLPRQGGISSYQEIYKDAIVENKVRNEMIANVANTMSANGRNILILVKHIEHGNILEKMIDKSTFLHGSHSKKERESHLELMKKCKAGPTISSSIFDEGVDVRPLNTLILAGSGKSSTRALQRVGRVLRKCELTNKKSALVVDFRDYCKHLKSHSDKREKIYRTEPLFIIKDYAL